MKKRILITGSNGVVGSFLVKILEERGHDVFGVDLFHDPRERGFEQLMNKAPGKYARCDISEYRQLIRVFEEFGPFDFVYNTAAEFGRWNGEDYYEQLWKTNAIGLKHIIRLQEKLGFKLIHFSSSEVYGDYPQIMKEEVMDAIEIKQLNDYALTKWVNEQQIKNSGTLHKTETVIVRLFNTYGPGEFYHAYRSVNSKFCYAAIFGLPVIVYKGHIRTSTYLKDTCETLANIVDKFYPGRIYNIGGTEEHTMEELVRITWDVSGADPKLITYADSEVLTTKNKRVDVSRAVNELGHKITVSLKEGIESTLEWMRFYYKIK